MMHGSLVGTDHQDFRVDYIPVAVVANHKFVLGHPLVATAVAGATCLPQLEELIASSCQPCLPEDVVEEIDAVHASYPSPTP
eukprot:1158878-Pelagomonas_calceolata.AAC.2